MFTSVYKFLPLVVLYSSAVLLGFIGTDVYMSSFFTKPSFTSTIVKPQYQELVINWNKFLVNINLNNLTNLMWSLSISTFMSLNYIAFIGTVFIITLFILMKIYNLAVRYFSDEKFDKEMQNAFTKPYFASDRLSSDNESNEENDNDSNEENDNESNQENNDEFNDKPYRRNSYMNATQPEDWDMIDEDSYVFNNDSVFESTSARVSPSKITKV
jgi:hypothetical protein